MEPRKYNRKDGTITYKLNGKLHKEDGPAVERTNGSKFWFIKGIQYNHEIEYWLAVQHYVNTQTLLYVDIKPRKYTHKNGKVTYKLGGVFHRLDGPAVKWANGEKFWYIHGTEYNELEYWIAVQKYTST